MLLCKYVSNVLTYVLCSLLAVKILSTATVSETEYFDSTCLFKWVIYDGKICTVGDARKGHTEKQCLRQVF